MTDDMNFGDWFIVMSLIVMLIGAAVITAETFAWWGFCWLHDKLWNRKVAV